jgi:hypothetical protein
MGKHSHFWIRAYKGITLTGDPFWTKIEETFSDPHFGKGRVLICGRPARCKRFLKNIGT